jgi:hypothetical protein
MTSTIKVDTISENTSANGVAVDGVTIKDGNVGAAGTATSVAGIPFFSDTTNGSIYTHDVSGTDDTAANNTAFGLTAMDAITTGDSNVAIGHAAGSAMTTSEKNVIVGKDAGLVKADSSNRGVHIGFESAKGLTTGSDILSIGYQSYLAADTETHNLAIGRAALGGSINGGEYNVAIGNYSLDALTSGDYNTALGYASGTELTTGERNVFIGHEAGKDCIGGGQNVAIGDAAGSGALSTAAGRNVMIGRNAGQGVTSGESNIYVGFEAGKATTIASNNVAVGYQSLDAVVVERQCVAIGGYALTAHRTTASSVNDTGNTAVGYLAGSEITTGAGNTLLGATAGEDLVGGSNNLFLGMLTQANGGSASYQFVIGHNVQAYTNSTTTIGYDTTEISTSHGSTSWAAQSDERYKKDITDSTAGLSFIDDLRPVTFKWKLKNEIDSNLYGYDADSTEPTGPNTLTQHGFIAQEVKTALDNHSEVKDGQEFWKQADSTRSNKQYIAPTGIIPMMVKAIQELSAKVKALEEA